MLEINQGYTTMHVQPIIPPPPKKRKTRPVMLSCMRYTKWYIMDNYFIILLTCWMSNRNIVCPDLRKLPGLVTNNMQHITPDCFAFINLAFASPCIIIR
jgi:hypothetical protein